MPEFPDITVYVESLRRFAGGSILEELSILNPFVLRTVAPKAEDFAGRDLVAVSRLGKRIVLSFSGEYHAVIHLMVAGRLRWRAKNAKPPARRGLATWTFSTGKLILTEVGDGFPEKVTAFREEMAVHGRYGQPCPDCGAPVQRIRYADSEANYCAGCQTGGRILADRSLSRLLKADWPKTLDDLERRSR